MADTESHAEDKSVEGAPSPSPRVVRTEELFDGDQEIWIEHAGDRYRLRITRRNKLILQK